MLKKVVSLYLGCLLLAAVFTGCIMGKCDIQNFHFQWKKLSLSSAHYTSDSNRVRSEPDNTTDFYGKRFMLQVVLNGETVAANFKVIPGFMNQAYACAYPGDTYEPNSKIATVRVYSVNAYDATHDAGAEITEYFKSADITQPTGLGPLNFSAVEGWYYEAPGTKIDLYMETKPTINKPQQFKVTVSFEDGSSFNELTPELRF